MDAGAEGGTLHGGGYDGGRHGEGYNYKSGRIMTGLTVVEYLLADEGPGQGGLQHPGPRLLLAFSSHLDCRH